MRETQGQRTKAQAFTIKQENSNDKKSMNIAAAAVSAQHESKHELRECFCALRSVTVSAMVATLNYHNCRNSSGPIHRSGVLSLALCCDLLWKPLLR